MTSSPAPPRSTVRVAGMRRDLVDSIVEGPDDDLARALIRARIRRRRRRGARVLTRL